MATIKFVARDDVEFRRPSPKDVRVEHGTFFPGSEDEPELFEVVMPPGYAVDAHAHSLREVITVVEGELQFGARKLGPGEAVMVPADTLYSFKVGPEGVRFLNFRARGGAELITKDEFTRRRLEKQP